MRVNIVRLGNARTLPRHHDKKASSYRMDILPSDSPQGKRRKYRILFPASERPCIKCDNAPRLEGKRWCRECSNAYHRSRYNYEQRRDSQLRITYGISLDEHNALRDAQDGVCAICKQPEKIRPGRSKRTESIIPMLHVDHNHVTGQIRGLLCSECNMALGMLHEDPKRIKALLDYARKWQK